MLEHSKQLSENDAEINQKFLQNNRDIEKYLDQQMLAFKEEASEERQKLDTIQQGRNQAYTIEIEGRILNKVEAILDENKKFKEDIFNKLDQSAQETESFYREAKEERLLFDTKLTTREAEIKEWAMKLLEENYEDFTRLLSAKS